MIVVHHLDRKQADLDMLWVCPLAVALALARELVQTPQGTCRSTARTRPALNLGEHASTYLTGLW